MPIADEYRRKSEELNELLDNQCANPELGKALLNLIHKTPANWNGYTGIFLPAYDAIYSFVGNQEQDLKDFSQQVINLCESENLAPFLDYCSIFDNFKTRHSFSAASFFLMLKYPDKHFVHLRNPGGNHPLITDGIVNPQSTNLVTIIGHLPKNNFPELNRRYQNLLDFISQYKRNYELVTMNNIDFMGYLEQL
jgi:hypothetical protein